MTADILSQRVTEEMERLKAEVERLRKGLQDYLDGNYGFDYGGIKTAKCQHGRYSWENCGTCIDEHFIELLSPSPFPSVSGGE